MKSTTEQFTIRQDPNNSNNWGIIWEHNGTEGGYTSESAARKSAIDQNGAESKDDVATWNW